jgi:hypothetical protein
VGVKRTASEFVPAGGTVAGVVHANVPAGEDVPPVRVAELRALPYGNVALEVGHAVMVGVALLIVTVPAT